MVQIAPSEADLSEALIARICRATPTEARFLSLDLPNSDRAKLAIFCNSRAHLRDQGRAIASTCSEASLFQEGGHAGLVLLQQVAVGPDTWGSSSRLILKGISLSRPKL